jgi:hypothetical protein
MVRVERENRHDRVELSPFQENPFGGQMLDTTDNLLQHKVTTARDKVPATPLATAIEGRQALAHRKTGGWFASLFRVPSRHRHVDVDADAASWWVEGEDRGPGMQESQIGRYDAWL